MIYSPSQTKTYLTCPTARMLSQEGWASRLVGIRDWAAWIGQGVHAGLAFKYAPPVISKIWNPGEKDVVRVGQDGFMAEFDHAISQGRIIPNTFFASEAKAHIERCLEYAIGHDLLPVGFEVERMEQSLGQYNCILDVVGKRNGKPTFIDWKVKNKCKPDYIDQELERYRYDWKEARHYPWALSQVTGQQVVEYTVVMFILQPFKVVSRTYAVNWPMVERWAAGCLGPKLTGELDGLWSAMTYEEPWQSNMCMGGQWPCEYLDACWTYDLDREKMRQGGLVQVQRIKKGVSDE